MPQKKANRPASNFQEIFLLLMTNNFCFSFKVKKL